MKIIWLGSVVKEDVVDRYPAVSPAGNKWQLRLIRSFLELPDINIICVGHRLERAFPYGRFFVNNSSLNYPENIDQVSVWYLNLPIFRILYLNVALMFGTLCTIIANRKSETIIISYNIYSYNVLPFLIGKLLRIKSIVIVADPINERSGKVNPVVNLSNGAIYLSKFLFDTSKLRDKINIEGGIEELSCKKNISNPFPNFNYILYTGKLSVSNGIELLLNAFSLLEDKDIRLVITGFGLTANLKNILESNERVICHEMVNSEDLIGYYKYARILVNPRLINSNTNDANFPSKLLEYLSYKKPIISTMTRGIPVEYENVIEFVYNDNERELAEKISEVLKWSDNEIKLRQSIITEFIKKRKSWRIIACSIKKFIDGL
jgi:glycosyltransferase involved in cell wall biosynthesis